MLAPTRFVITRRLLERSALCRYLARHWTLDRLLVALRWSAIGFLALESIVLPLPRTPIFIATVLALVVYNLLLLRLRVALERLIGRPGILLIDVATISAAVLLTGGLASPLYILYVPTLVAGGMHLGVARSAGFALLSAAAYGAVAFAPLGHVPLLLEIERAGMRAAVMLMVTIATAVLVRELQIQREATRRERALVQELQRANRQLATLNEVMRLSTSAHFDVDRILERISTAAIAAFDAELVLVACWERAPEGGPLRRSLQGAARWITDDRIPQVCELLSRHVHAARHRALCIDPAALDSAEERRLYDSEQLASAMLAPLLRGSEAIGLVWVAARRPGAYCEADAAYLSTLAHHGGLLLWNAWLYALERENVQRLRTLEAMKDDFLANVSHDLRTPLTAIKAAIVLLQEMNQAGRPWDGQAIHRLYHTIEKNCDRLNTLVSDLLDLARLRQGRLELSPQRVDVRELLENCLAAVRPLAERKQLRLECRLNGPLPPLVADPKRLEQVIVNLLTNAVQYTPPLGQVVLAACAGDTTLQITVQDSGPGISAADQPYIFDRFYRSRAPAVQRVQGAGLGLSIARFLVELHGGTISVASTEGKGATFIVCLPFAPEARQDQPCRAGGATW
jgi:signal transduction histidine kinase